MMALDDRGYVALRGCPGCRCRDFKKNIHSDGEIRAVQDRGTFLARMLFEARNVLIPARGSNNNRLARANARFDVLNDRFGSGEIAERTGVQVLLRSEHADGVSALARNFLNQRSGFSMTQ